jgi:hypothetical protein
MSSSRKQKINTRSSTESEVVGVNDAMPSILWSLYFLQEQGYGTTHAVVYQDNKSAILLETNGKWSSSKRTKHIKMKYFFVKDKVDDGEVKIEHLPTEKCGSTCIPSLRKAFNSKLTGVNSKTCQCTGQMKRCLLVRRPMTGHCRRRSVLEVTRKSHKSSSKMWRQTSWRARDQ